ncbi:MAG TPA: hypothetical protein GX736_01290 [Mogibacterium sp.]|nr:hypothetical protein [Mogibacterium sp.]
MEKEYKSVQVIMLGAYIISLFLYCFGNDKYVDGMNGLIMLNSPVAIAAIVIIVVGIIKRNSRHILMVIGSILLIVNQIYCFLTWPIPTINIAIDIPYSFSITHFGFYISLSIAIIMLVIGIFNLYKNKR